MIIGILPMNDLSALIAHVPLLSALTPDECKDIATQASLVSFAAGEIIIREGELGDRMYVIESGAVQVFTTSFDGSDIVLARLEKRSWFGEQALLPGGTGRRNASIRCLEPCRLLMISRTLLESALSNSDLVHQLRARGEAQRAFRSSKFHDGVFASLGLGTAEGSSYRVESYKPGDIIFRQGDRGDRLYLILSGTAEVRYHDGDSELVLAELNPGQFFGEVAILKDSPRGATVAASGDLDVVSLDGAWFRQMHEENPILRSLMDSLSSIYLLPRRGLLTMQMGTLEGKPALTAIHNLPSGRRVMSTKMLGTDAFTAQLLDGTAAAAAVTFEDAPRAIFRELNFDGNRLTRIVSEGEWTSLGEVLGWMLDDEPVEEWQLALFRERGNFRAQETKPLYEEKEIICACTQTTCGRIMQAVRGGATTVDAVAKQTNATMVCGGCKPLVRELLGQSDWTAARVVETIPRNEETRSFRIRPVAGGVRSYLPGQHLVIQARIDNRWVQRAYTISSAPGVDNHYEVTVKREAKGVFSRWLFERLQPDTVLRIAEPGGEYYLPESYTGDVVCLVGGIGITPALAMARTLARQNRICNLHVDYSASHESEFICREEIASLSVPDRVDFNFRVTRRDGRFELEQARAMHASYPEAIYFLCGSEQFMNGVNAQLLASGVPKERIQIEVFTVAGARPKEAAAKAGSCPIDHPAGPAVVPTTPLEQARQVLRDCYKEAGASSAFEPRWKQVEAEINQTGTYRQTYDELVYTARVAWRNSVKCIGRLYWQGLAVRDYRHVSTADEMFEAIFTHIETAFNGGNLRPTMTVFAPDRKLRIWSPQLFRYAGYQLPDGAVLGDPANVELTTVALSLGWLPPTEKSRFDLLPVILSDGGDPVWREIPQHLRFEVIIRHPLYDWFESLGLKWYAMRIVGLMKLEGGAVEYTAAPFNGWSMETEIGARIFTDENRYDMLKTVGEKLGLDTSNDRSLWKDRVLVELNIAVLYSFDKAGVKIADHHAASQAFTKFQDLEEQAGRTVYARWSWIVPPISGAVTAVYHREWPDVELTPNYVAQPDPWTDLKLRH